MRQYFKSDKKKREEAKRKKKEEKMKRRLERDKNPQAPAAEGVDPAVESQADPQAPPPAE